MVSLVRVTREMLPELAELHVRSWQVAYRGMLPDEYLDGLSVERRLQRSQERFLEAGGNDEYAILDDKQVVGLCVQGPDLEGEAGIAEIQAFYLNPEVFGQGYAHPAMKLALQELRAKGFWEVMLWVLEDNLRARRFYQRAGFVADGGRKLMSIGGRDVWEMRYRQALN